MRAGGSGELQNNSREEKVVKENLHMQDFFCLFVCFTFNNQFNAKIV